MTPVIDVHLEAMTSQPETRGEPGVRRKLIFALVLALGLLTGAGVFALGESEARWMAYALTALFGMLVLLLTKDKDRLLSLVFVLGLQMDVYLRLSYGRAGSTEGIALAFVSIVALMLICVRLFPCATSAWADWRASRYSRFWRQLRSRFSPRKSSSSASRN